MKKGTALIVSLAISLGVGGLSALLTRNSMDIYEFILRPPLSPPGWIFPVVWTVLFILMGIAAWQVWLEVGPVRDRALTLYCVQLAVNLLWPVLFFTAQRFGAALVWLMLLLALVIVTVTLFYRVRRSAGNLMIPYVLWICFALYLNAGVWILNR